VLERPEILRALRQKPIQQILICRLPEQGTSGVYSYDDRTVTLNSARKMGVHFGDTFRPGSTGNMSAATTDKLESPRRSLLHELAHLKRHDIALNWLIAGAQALHWFNPLVWMAARQMLVERERACDDLVLECACSFGVTGKLGDAPSEARGPIGSGWAMPIDRHLGARTARRLPPHFDDPARCIRLQWAPFHLGKPPPLSNPRGYDRLRQGVTYRLFAAWPKPPHT